MQRHDLYHDAAGLGIARIVLEAAATKPMHRHSMATEWITPDYSPLDLLRRPQTPRLQRFVRSRILTVEASTIPVLSVTKTLHSQGLEPPRDDQVMNNPGLLCERATLLLSLGDPDAHSVRLLADDHFCIASRQAHALENASDQPAAFLLVQSGHHDFLPQVTEQERCSAGHTPGILK